jgi:hypothetical protein
MGSSGHSQYITGRKMIKGREKERQCERKERKKEMDI